MTRRSSVRAQAQEIYRERAADAAYANASPEGERNLTAQVRALYEGSAAPVREIALLAGVTERTIYKYAAKHNWKPRYRWRPDGARPSHSGRDFAPVKGVGGRFISRADVDKPFAMGLKAIDPAAAAQAGARCAQAAALGAEAERQVEADTRRLESLRAMTAINRAQRNLTDYLAQREKDRWGRRLKPGWPRSPGKPIPENDPVEHALRVSLHATIDWWDAVANS